jgi:cell division protease FtsH
MTTIRNAPDQPVLDPKVWDWEQEGTVVSGRLSWRSRIIRFFRGGWWWKILLVLFIIALLVPPFMSFMLTVFGVALRIALFMVIAIIQFVAIFWFLGRARIYEVEPGAEGISFKDYRGQPELLEQAEQIVLLLRGVKAFEKAGGEPLNGLLLEGPPGTGKTWLAKAISTEAGVPFFYVDTSSLQGMFIGTGTLKVQGVYRKARKAANEYGAAVIFLDEIDSVGARGGVSTGGPQAGLPGGMSGMGGGDMSGLLTTLLVEMSGFNQEYGWRAKLRNWWWKTFRRQPPPRLHRRVLTIGATNRMQALDAALLRPGRFDKKIRVDAPDMLGRRDIFEYYLSKMAHDSSMDPGILSTETAGYTPADIKYVLNESLRYALFAGRRYMTYADFRMAQPEHEMGVRAPLKHISPEAKRRMAYHEAGHAVAVRLFMPHHRIARVTIIRQGEAFGHVSHYPARESYQGMMTKAQWLNDLKVSVAGRAAEIEFCGVEQQTLSVTRRIGMTPSDFERIRNVLSAMARAGMFGALGAAIGRPQDMSATGTASTLAPTPEMAIAMEEQFQELLRDTRQALRENKVIVDALVKLLLEKEELLADEVRAFFDQYGLYTPDPSTILNGEEISLLTTPPPQVRLQAQNQKPEGTPTAATP